MAHERLGQIDEAAAQHDAAVASGHANAGTFYERGMFRLRRNDLAGGAQDLRQAVRLDPAWPAPRQALQFLGAD
jgi:Tfp pilus assembly protein PilF